MGPAVEQEGARGGETAGAPQSVRGIYKSFKGTNLTVLHGIHQFIMYIV